jgi:type IV pilus assembly protein PilB
MTKPLCDVVRELGYVTDEQIRQTVRSNQRDLRIGDLLNGLGYLPDEELHRALALQAQQGRQQKLGDVLIQHKFLADDKLTEILALQLGLPVLELTAKEPDPGLIGRGPVEYYEQYRFVPYDMQADGSVRIGFVDPLDPRSLDAARDYFGKNIVVCITRVSQLDELLAKRKEDLRLGVASDQGRLQHRRHRQLDHSRRVQARRQRHSRRAHVGPPARTVPHRRGHGSFPGLPIGAAASLVSPLQDHVRRDIAEKRRHWTDGSFSATWAWQIDLRMSFYVTVYGEQIVMRLLKSRRSSCHERTGHVAGMLSRFMEEALDAPSGVIMVTGPTGSGKSTTVYSCINYLNRPR